MARSPARSVPPARRAVVTVLALADAFALHTGLEPAHRLAEHLSEFLLERLPALEHLAATDLTVITGAAGPLAVLLSRDPARRDWLSALGMRY